MNNERVMCDIGSNDDQWRQTNPEASGSMFFWADRLLQISQEIKDLELEIKRLKNVYDNAEQTLFDMMLRDGVDQFKRGGYAFSPTIKTRASIRAEVKDRAYQWLKNSEFSDLVKETVNVQSLNSLLKDWRENGLTPDMEHFYQYLNLYDEQQISVKRG